MLLALIAAFLVLGAGVWAFQTGPVPERWLAALTATLSEQLGADVSIRSVSLAGFDRIALHDVHVDDGNVTVTAERIVAVFSAGELLRRPSAPLSALRWVRADHWQVVLPANGLPTDGMLTNLLNDGVVAEWLAAAGIHLSFLYGDGASDGREAPIPADRGRQDGDVTLSGQLLSDALMESLGPLLDHDWPDDKLEVYLQNGQVVIAEAGDLPTEAGDLPTEATLTLSMDGAFVLGDGQLVVRNVKMGVAAAAAASGSQTTVNGVVWPQPDLYVNAAFQALQPSGKGRESLGSARAEAWLTGSWHTPDAWGTVHAHNVVLPWWTETTYALDEVVIQWGYRPGRPIPMIVDAARGGARLRMDGELLSDGGLRFDVVAADVQVPEDVPPLQDHDVVGTIDVSGRLTGTLAAPVLEADVSSDGGYLFRQPVSGVQGWIQLTTTEFVFAGVRVTQGNSDYFLDGEIGLFAEKPFDFVLHTERGRAETVLSALGWDVPVRSHLAGTVQFARFSGPIVAAGDVSLTRGSAWQQPFDRLDGSFQYADGAFQVTDVAGTVRGGTVSASGGSLPSGDGWMVDVRAEDIPLQAIATWREQLPGVSGVFDFVGTAGNGPAPQRRPRLEGTLSARHLAIGALDFATAEGDVAWEDDTLSTSGLTLHRRGGGVYDVVGRVTDVLAAPEMDLDIDVRDESVESLLALSDWRLPLLAHSDPVRAKAVVSGPLADPAARIRVEAEAVYVVGRPAPLALDLRWRDGRIEIENGVLQQGNV